MLRSTLPLQAPASSTFFADRVLQSVYHENHMTRWVCAFLRQALVLQLTSFMDGVVGIWSNMSPHWNFATNRWASIVLV